VQFAAKESFLRRNALQKGDTFADKKGVQTHVQPAGIGKDQRLPNHLVWCVVALCALPLTGFPQTDVVVRPF
jgi:hypothetical protein